MSGHLVFAAFLALAAPGHAEDAAPRASTAMRVALLTERVAKLHAQVGQGILADRSLKALTEAARDLEASVAALAAAPASPEVHDNYVMLRILAGEYRAWALRPPTRDNARKLAERAEEIVWLASKNARLAEQQTRTPNGSLALAAIQAATLAQRAARLQLARRWGLREDPGGRELEAATRELRGKLDLLAEAAKDSPQIAGEVQVSFSQYQFLVQAADPVHAAEARRIEFVAKSADHIVESMERTARLYETMSP